MHRIVPAILCHSSRSATLILRQLKRTKVTRLIQRLKDGTTKYDAA